MNLEIRPVVDKWYIAEPCITTRSLSAAYEYSGDTPINATLVERPDGKIHVLFKINQKSTKVYEAVFDSAELARLNCKERMQMISNTSDIILALERDILFA